MADKSIVDEHDIEDRDELYGELFDHAQELRRRGYTPKEIVPRLRELADSIEDHFEGTSSWDQCPAEKDVDLAGDSEE